MTKEGGASHYVKYGPKTKLLTQAKYMAWLAGYQAREAENGWVEIKEGCEMPTNIKNEDNDILFFCDFVYMGICQNGKFYYETGYEAHPTHWKRLPAPPTNI